MGDIIQSLWIGESLGVLERLSITSFLKQGHEYHLYTYGTVAEVPAGVVLWDGNEILPASRIFSYQSGFGRGSVSAFSNLFRYKLLAERGGWWVDTDVVCLKAFQFAEGLVLAGEHHRNHPWQTASAVIKVPLRHELARTCLTRAAAADPQRVMWGQIGPQLLSSVVQELKLQAHALLPEVFCPLPWWEFELLLREPDELSAWLTERTHAIHLWHECWRNRGYSRKATFAPGAPITRLLQQYGI